MLRRVAGFVVFVHLAAGMVAALGDAPKVVRAVPDNGDTDVDPDLTELRFEFDQDMSQSGHSVCGGGDSFPEIDGKPKWESKRTFVLPVKLKPDHQYNLSVNCPAAQNFRGADGAPAQNYPISFKTRAAGAAPAAKLTVEQNKAAIAALKKAIDEKYSYRDLRKVDWTKVFEKYAPKLLAAETSAEFGRAAAELLGEAQDIHISVQVGKNTLGTHRRSGPINFRYDRLAKDVPNFKRVNEVVATGRFDDGIGYILITTWSNADRKAFEALFAALDELKDCRGLIIDVRPNGGGDERLAREFAGCFVRKAAVYSKNTYRDPKSKSGFTDPIDRRIEPNGKRPPFEGKVVVLVGPGNMSSNESFILMMRHGAGAKLVGAQTYGSSGNPKPHDLGNGVTVLLPSWQDLDADGKLLEGVGVRPDVAVEYSPTGDKPDAVIEAGRAALK
jgi:hypothetical protein